MTEYKTISTSTEALLAWCSGTIIDWRLGEIGQTEWGVATINAIPNTGYLIVTFFRATDKPA